MGRINSVFDLAYIAEAGVNHNGSLDLAIELCNVAKKANADYVKFQTFKTESLIAPGGKKAGYHLETTGSDEELSWFELLKSQELSFTDFETIKNHCKKIGIGFASTPYDIESALFLKSIGIEFFKVASTDITNIGFLDALAKLGLPVVFSTGMATMIEIERAFCVLANQMAHRKIGIFHCVAEYPAPEVHACLGWIEVLSKKFEVAVGYSDHHTDVVTSLAAATAGAVMYERHFSLDKTMAGPDHRASLSPEELESSVELFRRGVLLRGSGRKVLSEVEIQNKHHLQKTLVYKRSMGRGHLLTDDDVIALRGGGGICASQWFHVVGRPLSKDVKMMDAVDIKDLV